MSITVIYHAMSLTVGTCMLTRTIKIQVNYLFTSKTGIIIILSESRLFWSWSRFLKYLISTCYDLATTAGSLRQVYFAKKKTICWYN